MAKQSHTPSKFPALDRAIKRHRAAYQVFHAAVEDDVDNDVFGPLCDAEDDARLAIAMRRFKSDEEFLEALRYLITAERKIYGRSCLDEFPATIQLVARYFGGEIEHWSAPAQLFDGLTA